MKKNIIIVLLLFISVTIQAQYTSSNQIVLPILELKDKQLLVQLDSVLFVKYPCSHSPRKEREQYTYFVKINEDSLKNYTISIIYAKPSEVENDINTGIYKINEKTTLIIRENSQYPLFTKTVEKENFKYKKQLMKDSDDYNLIEIVFPEEFCIFVLSYSKKQLKILELS